MPSTSVNSKFGTVFPTLVPIMGGFLTIGGAVAEAVGDGAGGAVSVGTGDGSGMTVELGPVSTAVSGSAC